ncbi:hypothetical protein MRX96_048286, partial [Rhipicephalus microplus]
EAVITHAPHCQNSSILDGLALWKLWTKRFEGSKRESTLICFSCFTAPPPPAAQALLSHLQEKRFHSDCLFKWFNTSNNSSCPLCRNVF